MKKDYISWAARGGLNQFVPILMTFVLVNLNQVELIAQLVPIFASVSLANLIRSGALTSSPADKNPHTVSVEIGYSLFWTIPFIFTVASHSLEILLFASQILVVSALSGVFAARLERDKGLHGVAIYDIASMVCAAPMLFVWGGISTSAIAKVFLLREMLFFFFLLFSICRKEKTLAAVSGQSQTLFSYCKRRLPQTLFWATGPWKDYVVTNIGVALYSNEIYGAFYATQLYWSLPVLFVGLLLRPNLRQVQLGRLSPASIRRNMIVLMAVSIIMLAFVDALFDVTPKTSALLIASALLSVALTPFVTAATIEAAANGRNRLIVTQNLIWTIVPCLSLTLLRSYELMGIAVSLAATHLSSLYILKIKK